MADQLSSIVQVSITANSKSPTRLGFGTPLILTYHTRFTDQFRVYSDLNGMTSDGFTTYDAAYRKAAAVFAQNPTVQQVVVGRMSSAPSFTTLVTITSNTQGQVVSMNVIQPATGTVSTISYTIGASETTTTVATAVTALIAAVSGVSASSSGAVITVTPTAAGRKVHIYSNVNCNINETTAAAGYDTALTSLQNYNDDWYFVLIDSASPANVAAVGAWVLSHPPKLFFWDSSDNDLAAGTVSSGTMGEAATNLKAAANGRVIGMYHPYSHEAIAAAWVGVGAPQTPGSITWALKTLIGPTATTLTTTQRTNLEAVNVNHYQPVRGINVTRKGVVASGEWIDVTHGIDALTADIQQSVFAVLANSGKVPFSGAGLDLIDMTITAALRRFEGSADQPGLLIVKSGKVAMPALTSISSADKQARQLNNVKFSGTLAGAIHFVSVVGTVSY